jgi:carboxylesterase type B
VASKLVVGSCQSETVWYIEPDRTAPNPYDGGNIVSRSIEMGTPIIFVSMNFRSSGLGFLASEEVKAARVGNLGLEDRIYFFACHLICAFRLTFYRNVREIGFKVDSKIYT